MAPNPQERFARLIVFKSSAATKSSIKACDALRPPSPEDCLDDITRSNRYDGRASTRS
jgi:hypothetical protein